jgi:hypothetical protein
VGNAPLQTLNWVIPKGEKGDAGATNSLKIGTVVAGINPAATITGNAPDQTLNLVLPRGEKGDAGAQGTPGVKGDRGDVGPKGDTGAGAVIKGTASAYPPVANPVVNDLYILGSAASLTGAPASSVGPASVGDGVVWTGTSWVNVGPLRGSQGIQGNVGPSGPAGPAGPATTLAIGAVSAGTIAQASLTGTAPNQTLNLVLPKGDAGVAGPKGDAGAVGPAGPPNSLTVGTVTQGVAGSAPTVTITGVAPAQTISFRFPVPADPAVNKLSIGTVTQGGVPSATITGTPPNQILNLVLPNPQVTQSTSFSVNPVNASGFVGESVSFTATAQSTEGPLVYKWQVSNDNGATFADITGAGTNTYTFTPVLADSGKRYRCVATTPTLGPTYSLIATLTVTVRPIPDGSSWRAGVANGSGYIEFLNGLFIAGNGRWSTDGAEWTNAMPTGIDLFHRGAFGNGTWVAGKRVPAEFVTGLSTRPEYFVACTSADGKNWTARESFSLFGGNLLGSQNAIFGYGFGKFVCFYSTERNYYVQGSTVVRKLNVIVAMWSSDGITWNNCPAITGMVTGNSPLNTAATGFTATAQANAFTRMTSVATGTGNSPLMVATGLIVSGATNQYLASADGITWVLKTFPAFVAVQDVAFGATNFVAVGTGGVCFRTATPATPLTTASIAFSVANMPATASWSGITYGNGKFVAVANGSATAANSVDGATWAQKTLPSSSLWDGVAFGNNRFIASAAAGTTTAATAISD